MCEKVAQSSERKIFVDFEWQRISGEYAKPGTVGGNEIIQFGAVMLGADESGPREFRRYVKPRYVHKLSKHIQELTGISDEMLADAPDFQAVLAEFIDWCGRGEGGYTIYSWSDSDLIQIKKEMELKDIPRSEPAAYMLANWNDLQHEFDTVLGFEKQLSLADALFAAGVDAVGTAHDALDDARNTAMLYDFLNDPVKQQTTIRNIRSVLCHEDKAPTLGDLIDWSRFSYT